MDRQIKANITILPAPHAVSIHLLESSVTAHHCESDSADTFYPHKTPLALFYFQSYVPDYNLKYLSEILLGVSAVLLLFFHQDIHLSFF